MGIVQRRGIHFLHHEVEGCDERLFAVRDAHGDGAVGCHRAVEHLVNQLLGFLFLLRDAVLMAEGTDGRVHAEEVEVGTVNLEHLLADALYEGLGGAVDGRLEDLPGRAVLVDIAEPSYMKNIRVLTSWANFISWVTMSIVMPSLAN